MEVQMTSQLTVFQKIKKILIIDDSDSIQVLISSSIKKKNKTIEVISCSNGAEGIELAIKEQPQIILIDMIMHRMGGFETLQKIKNNENTSHILCVMLKPINIDSNIILFYRDNGISFIDKNLYGIEKFSSLLKSYQEE